MRLIIIMVTVEVKTEPEDEVLLGTSGGSEQVISEVSPEYDSDQFDDEYIAEYCEMVDIPHPMTISKELFYMDEMVARCYEHLSKEDKARFDQMKILAESIKQETGDYGLIEDLMVQVVAQCFGRMRKEDVASIMGKEGEGAKGGKELEQVAGRL